MKTSSFFKLATLVALLLTAGYAAEMKPGSWAELKGYHSVMSTTFHPAEEGKLEPIKTRSAELAAAASAWLKSTPPAEFNKPAILAKLKLLDTESAALDALIKSKKASDAEITAALTKLHDRFHEIVGACSDEIKAAKK